eukprot:3854278-Amphidinium_carterae.2
MQAALQEHMGMSVSHSQATPHLDVGACVQAHHAKVSNIHVQESAMLELEHSNEYDCAIPKSFPSLPSTFALALWAVTHLCLSCLRITSWDNPVHVVLLLAVMSSKGFWPNVWVPSVVDNITTSIKSSQVEGHDLGEKACLVRGMSPWSVSYTHLTLPTILLV